MFIIFFKSYGISYDCPRNIHTYNICYRYESQFHNCYTSYPLAYVASYNCVLIYEHVLIWIDDLALYSRQRFLEVLPYRFVMYFN